MNLSTAQSIKRAKEVGLRKVLGAYRLALVRQFIIESVLFAILGMIIAVVLVLLTLPTFNTFVDKTLSLSFGTGGLTLLILLGITVLVGVLAGSYPAFYLSSFKPATILKGGGKSTGSKFSLRSLLVILQFAISITLIIGVGIVQHQITFMQNKELGFNKNDLIVLPANQEIHDNFEALQQRFEAQPGIKTVSLSSRMPSGRLLDSQGTQAEVDGQMKQISFRVADIHVDHTFLDKLEVNFAAGRNFDVERASDSTQAFILNAAAVKAIGWSSAEESIGKKFMYGGRTGEVIGVVKDFHFESLHQEIAPIVFLVTQGRSRNVAMRIDRERQEETLAYLQEQWSYLRPGFPFSYYFVDDRLSENYNNEAKLNSLVKLFSMLALIIASLGLFGLSSFISEMRIKEIGIRKVMGATIAQILILLTQGFTALVAVAFVLAAPIAYLVMQAWLTNFAYAASIPAGPFILAITIAILIAWITVSYQTIKAAISNPINSLRYE